MPTVEDMPVLLKPAARLIQNLGPDPIFVGEEGVTEDDGIQLLAGQGMSVSYTNYNLFMVSSGTADVRTLGQGDGIFSFDLPEAPTG